MKEFWDGHLFLILLLRAQENEFNQTLFCIRSGGVYNVHQSRVIILSGAILACVFKCRSSSILFP